MRILVIASWYPRSQEDHRGQFFRVSAEALVRSGNAVWVLAPEATIITRKLPPCERARHGWCDHGHENGARVFRSIRKRVIPGKFSNNWAFFFEWLSVRKLADSFREEFGKFDVILAQSAYWAGYSAMRLSRRLAIPYIVIEHRSNFITGKLPVRARKCLQDIFNRSNGVIAVSRSLLVALKERFKIRQEKSDVIPNMVSRHFKYLPAARDDDKIRICVVGGLVPIKRHDIIISAFARVLVERKNIELHIVGDGPLRRTLQRLSEATGCNHAIVWHGRLQASDVAATMSQCDFLVVGSDVETFGVVAAEALMSGVPVLATRCGGLEDIVDIENGLLVEPGSIESMETGMRTMLERFYMMDRMKVSEKALSKWGESAVVKKTEEFLKEVILRHQKGVAIR